MTAALIATSDIFNRIAEFGGDGRRFGQGHCHRQRLEKMKREPTPRRDPA